MAGKISDLTEKTSIAASDLLEMVSGTTNYKVQKSNFLGTVLTGLESVTASVDEINVLDGIPATLTATELGYVDGVTSAIQTQLDAKQSTLINSAGLLAALSDETGTGLAVFNTSPTLVTPTLGVAIATSINKVTITAPATSATLTIAQGSSLITAGAYAITLTATNTTEVTLPTTGTLSTLAGTETLTNKRITKRCPTVTQAAEPAINTDVTDVAHITGLAQAITSMTTNLTGTPVQGDTLRIDITDDGTARAITWGAKFESSGNVTLPTTTVLGVRLDVGFFWNTVTSKWRCVAVA